MVAEKAEINVGDRVKHPKLGEGEVLDIHPFGEERCAVISFDNLGQKKVILKYAKMQVIQPEEGKEAEGEEEES
jgi:DNA helicase-2/ATP-dependent DNA helicase PcrA